MGMLVEGIWSDEDRIIKNGAFVRQKSVHDQDISNDIALTIIQEPGRFHLIGSWSCPWSHRTLIMRQAKMLHDYIPLHMTGGERIEGYPANYGNKWQVPGSEKYITHLHQLYTINHNQHTGRATVPILWDGAKQIIISDESSKIMRLFNKVETQQASINFLPHDKLIDINEMNDEIYHNLCNGVYKAGFAKSQVVYDEAIKVVFTMMEKLESILSINRYLLGEMITEVDWRLFPTLVRFDIDYYLHSKCSQKKLTDFPNLWAYARDLYSWQGMAETIDFNAIHLSNYQKNDIIGVMPDIDWSEAHNRDALSIAQVCLMSGEKIEI
ncbi:glutathione S-transferase C-terminal domain-containing protein [Pseudoalteromonas denitrificans]|uniref:Putative glutathione S-transferase n=1 Tax=Pseudoalteromonas denitrificans DSM 6059 TaxID=1123010 RepID=A0A1I1KMI2_9GAMM|nr:glutathione S-transferase C-terminal domain-containing protein [Pseudoalteromonas denitrificans]SFC61901.1 putative glutathione S-transferase [Pseudoalteromonas denitrificans DSM 6059]